MNKRYKVECINKFESARSYKERIRAYLEYTFLECIEACMGGYDATARARENDVYTLAAMMQSMGIITMDTFGEVCDCVRNMGAYIGQ